MLLRGFTGPLSKVPGPFISKFTGIPWWLRVFTGTHNHAGPGFFKKYGPVVRVGKFCSWSMIYHGLNYPQAPNDVIVASKDGIRKILVDVDLPKAYVYKTTRENKDIGTLFSEIDKAVYKEKVHMISQRLSIELTECLRNACYPQGLELAT
jgi:hypothetical protein